MDKQFWVRYWAAFKLILIGACCGGMLAAAVYWGVETFGVPFAIVAAGLLFLFVFPAVLAVTD